ncbi:MAG: GGDEF domain-containing protein [Lachnospiraceae bacterium]|nr:GGDEF domain-containing protein [Lachnospiraceae bacterium]
MSDKRWKIGVFLGNVHFVHPRAMMAAMEEYFRDKSVDVLYFLGTESVSFVGDLTDAQAQFDYQYLSIYDYEKFEEFDFLIIAFGNMNIAAGIENKLVYLEKFAHIPCAVLQDVVPPKKGFNVISDNYGGMKHIVDHLIEFHEFENIVLLCGPEHNEDSTQRRQAYLESMISHGCAVSDSMIRYGDYTENVDDIAEELLNVNRGVQAVVCANDEMASAVYRVCEKRGLRVGVDIAVTGFDDIPLASFLNPPLTTVRQESRELGRTAARLALEYLEGQEVPAVTKIPTTLIPRNSCGCNLPDEKMDLATARDESVSGVVDDIRRIWNYALMGPIVTRELVSVSDNIISFFSRMAKNLIDMGVRSSKLYVQFEPMINTVENGYTMADEVHLVFEQNEDKFHVYPREDSPLISLKRGLIPRGKPDEPGRQYFTFLIFDGEKQYGILILEVTSEDIPYMYLMSLHFGTAFHFHEINNNVTAERDKLMMQNARLSYSAHSDPLTGLLNRRGVEELIHQTVNENEGIKACLMIGDLDHLKEINDTFGHNEGDFAIKACSEVLRRVIGDRAPLGRIGGDEFLGMFLVYDNEEQEIGRRLADVKLSADLFNAVSGKPYYLGISIGTACFECSASVSIESLIREADKSLYDAKKKRRSSVKKSTEDIIKSDNAEGFDVGEGSETSEEVG